jgi:hypothetical protein
MKAEYTECFIADLWEVEPLLGGAWRLCQSNEDPPVTTSTPPGMSLSLIEPLRHSSAFAGLNLGEEEEK